MADEGGHTAAANPEIQLNTHYFIRTLFGVLVLIELALSLITGACSSGTWSYCPGHYGFLAFVAWTCFINLFIFTILKLIGLWDKFRMFWILPHPIIPLIAYGLAVIGFFIGSILALTCANKATGAGTAAAVFALVTLAVFVVELFFAAKAFRNPAHEAQQQAPKYDPEPVGVV